MIKYLLLVMIMSVAFYALYQNGFLVLNAKRAAMFAGSRLGKSASFTSCSGTVRRKIRFRESRRYRFTFLTELSKGEVILELTEPGGKELLRLDSSNTNGEIAVEAGKRYGLTIRFQAASGKYELEWE